MTKHIVISVCSHKKVNNSPNRRATGNFPHSTKEHQKKRTGTKCGIKFELWVFL